MLHPSLLPIACGLAILGAFAPLARAVPVAATDDRGAPEPVEIEVVEHLVLDDAATLTPAVVLLVVEGLSLGDGDAVALTPAPRILVQEGLALADVVTVSPAVRILVQEAFGLADTVAVSPAVHIFVQEAIGTAVSSGPAAAPRISSTELLALADFVTVEVSADAPPGVELVRTVGRWPGGVVEPGAAAGVAVTQALVLLTKPAADPPGDSGPGDVTSPESYRLVAAGADGTIATASCEGEIDPSDLEVGLVPFAHPDGPMTAAVLLAGSEHLLSGRYRLFLCAEGIVDEQGDPLDGDGDGEGGDDFALDFRIGADPLVANPNFDVGLLAWEPDPEQPEATQWDPRDVGGEPSSGSVRLVGNAATAVRVSQCAWLPDATVYDLRFAAHRLSGEGSLLLEVEWFESEDCTGASLGVEPFDFEVETDVWLDVAGRFAAPSSSRSVRLGWVSLPGPSPDEVLLDEVLLLVSGLLFTDGFESGDLSAWSPEARSLPSPPNPKGTVP